MSDKFIFKGQTSFINKPHNIVIKDFQNKYITGNDTNKDKTNLEIAKLIGFVHKSKDLPAKKKEETIQSLHVFAKKLDEEKTNKSSLKKVLQKIKKVTVKAADIATPALNIISTILKLIGTL